jgi:flagellar hook-associated protein 2
VTITFSGLATGIDTSALVDQLVALERVPAERLLVRKAQANRRMSVVSDLVSRLTALKNASKALDTQSEVRAVTARSSDDKRVKVSSSGAAQPAQLALRVDKLAQGQTNVSTLFAAADDPMAGSGTLGITVGAGAEVVVSFTSLDTLADIASRINEEVPGTHAEVIKTTSGFQIALSSSETGEASALAFTESGTSLGFLEGDSLKQIAQDAAFTMNGISMTRSSNTVTDAVGGLTFELLGTHAVTDPDTTIAVASDPGGVETKLKSLVDAFNAVSDLVSAQMVYSGVPRGGDTLFGDSTVRSLQRGMAQVASATYPRGEGTTSLGQVGVEIDRNGRMSIDSAQLAKALADDPAALDDLIAGDEGFGNAVDELVTQFTQTGDGALSAKKSSLTKEMSRYDVEIGRIEVRATRIGDQLHAQFTTLESLMSSLRSQQATLSALFG